MAQVKIEREKAAACALAAARTTLPSGRDFFTGGTSIDFEVRLRRFRDALANLPASLKAMQDGLCRGLVDRPGTFAVLPDGDGPDTGYIWNRPTQVKVKTKFDEGVLVTIRSLAYDRDRDTIDGSDCGAPRDRHADAASSAPGHHDQRD